MCKAQKWQEIRPTVHIISQPIVFFFLISCKFTQTLELVFNVLLVYTVKAHRIYLGKKCYTTVSDSAAIATLPATIAIWVSSQLVYSSDVLCSELKTKCPNLLYPFCLCITHHLTCKLSKTICLTTAFGHF